MPVDARTPESGEPADVALGTRAVSGDLDVTFDLPVCWMFRTIGDPIQSAATNRMTGMYGFVVRRIWKWKWSEHAAAVLAKDRIVNIRSS